MESWVVLVSSSGFCYHAVSRYHQEALRLLISHNRCNAGVACGEWCAGQTHANGSVSILDPIALTPPDISSCHFDAWNSKPVSSNCASQGYLMSDCVSCVQVACAPPPRTYECHEWLGGRAQCIQTVSSAVLQTLVRGPITVFGTRDTGCS